VLAGIAALIVSAPLLIDRLTDLTATAVTQAASLAAH
jgi:flagellar biosynthetic protein FliR